MVKCPLEVRRGHAIVYLLHSTKSAVAKLLAPTMVRNKKVWLNQQARMLGIAWAEKKGMLQPMFYKKIHTDHVWGPHRPCVGAVPGGLQGIVGTCFSSVDLSEESINEQVFSGLPSRRLLTRSRTPGRKQQHLGSHLHLTTLRPRTA